MGEKRNFKYVFVYGGKKTFYGEKEIITFCEYYGEKKNK